MDNKFQSNSSSSPDKDIKKLTSGKKIPQWWVIVIAVVLLAALAYGVFGYWKPFQPSPQEVLEESFQKMANYESYQSDLEGQFELGLSAEQAQNFPTNSIGTTINAEIKTIPPKNKSEVSLSTEIKLANLPVTVAGMIKAIDQNLYVRADNLSLIEMFLPSNNLTGQWIEIPLDEVTKTTTSTKDNSFLTKMDEYQKEMLTTINKYPPFKVIKTLDSEEIMETDCHHYKVGVDMVNFKKVALKAVDFISQETEVATSTEEGLQKFEEEWNNFATNNPNLNFEIWISKKTNNIRRIDFGQEDQLVNIDLGEQIVKVFFTQDYYKINEDFKITTPEDYKTLQELLQSGDDLSGVKEGLLQF